MLGVGAKQNGRSKGVMIQICNNFIFQLPLSTKVHHLLIFFSCGSLIFLFIPNPFLHFSIQNNKTFLSSKMPHSFLILLSLFLFFSFISSQNPPSPGYFPSNQVQSIAFDHGFRNRWGSQHQKVDQGTLTIWLDSSSGIL